MAAIVGQLLEILAVPELSQLYETSIRKMQPAELVRRLASEKVSTRGHMPELRGRLLRLEALKLHPELDVPWYREDSACVVEEPAVQNHAEDLLNKFFRVTRYQETQLQRIRSRLSAMRLEKSNRGRTDEPRGGDRLHAVVDELDETMRKYLVDGEDTIERYETMVKSTLDSSLVKDKDEIIDESKCIFDENLDEETQEKTNDASDYIFDENLDEETRKTTNHESDRSSDSIVRIDSDQDAFEIENLDENPMCSWGKALWLSGSESGACTYCFPKVD